MGKTLTASKVNIQGDDVWHQQEFINLAPEVSPLDINGLLSDIGIHSGRKCPTGCASNRGAHINEVEIRGRWKGQKGGRAIFRYVNIQQEYEDAKVAALLCRMGAVRYKVKDAVADTVTDACLCEHVVPNIHCQYADNHRLCRVLGIALLYICFKQQRGRALSGRAPRPSERCLRRAWY